jgi:hypothetical protein
LTFAPSRPGSCHPSLRYQAVAETGLTTNPHCGNTEIGQTRNRVAQTAFMAGMIYHKK